MTDAPSRHFKNGTALALTRIEFNMLLFLASNPGVTLSKEDLFFRRGGPGQRGHPEGRGEYRLQSPQKAGRQPDLYPHGSGRVRVLGGLRHRLKCLPQSKSKQERQSCAARRPRRLGTATRISASLFRWLSAFFGSASDQDPKAAKFAVLTPGRVGFPNHAKQSPPPARNAPVSPCETHTGA